jgi:O-acetyl-ADP-ribose deacetylase (regulator of RNase III)/uncharacterized protein YwgA
LAFRKSFPAAYDTYLVAVENAEIKIGRVQAIETGLVTPKFIINFPTKVHWRQPSKLEYIDAGLKSLIHEIIEKQIQSISIPPLGCGNGKLEWKNVKPLILKHITPLESNIDFIIFEPGYSDQNILKKENVELTPARAMLLYLLKQYQVLGYSCNLLVAQKLAYFLQRFGEPLNLDFQKGFYGPYAHKLHHLLKFLNGFYIWFNEEDNKPGANVNLDHNNYSKVQSYFDQNVTLIQKERVKKVIDFIDGYESPYGLELLATVDFVMKNIGSNDIEAIKLTIYNWTTRKQNLMKPHHIIIATDHINKTFSGIV